MVNGCIFNQITRPHPLMRVRQHTCVANFGFAYVRDVLKDPANT